MEDLRGVQCCWTGRRGLHTCRGRPALDEKPPIVSLSLRGAMTTEVHASVSPGNVRRKIEFRFPTTGGFHLGTFMDHHEHPASQPCFQGMDRKRHPGRLRVWLGICAGDAHMVEANDHDSHRSGMQPSALPLGRSHRGDAREFRLVVPGHARDRCVSDSDVAVDIRTAKDLDSATQRGRSAAGGR